MFKESLAILFTFKLSGGAGWIRNISFTLTGNSLFSSPRILIQQKNAEQSNFSILGF